MQKRTIDSQRMSHVYRQMLVNECRREKNLLATQIEIRKNKAAVIIRLYI